MHSRACLYRHCWAILLACLLCLSYSSWAADCLPSQDSKRGGERILHYAVHLTMRDDGSVDVEECIQYDFGAHRRHGIERDIPTRVGSLDAGLRLLEVRLDGHEVKHRSWAARRRGVPMLHIRIGDPHQRMQGNHAWSIHYRMRRPFLVDADGIVPLHWNTIGAGWKVPIDVSESWYTLPAALSSEHVRLDAFHGPGNGRKLRNEVQWLDANHLYLSTSRLPAGHGLYMVLRFPASALPSLQPLPPWWAWADEWLWAVAFSDMLLLAIVWLLLGRDPRVPAAAFRQILPPVDAAMAGLLDDGSVDDRDISAAILSLAADGYLHMEKKADVLRLIKNRNANERALSEYRRTLFRALFRRGDVLLLDARKPDIARFSRLRVDLEKVRQQMLQHATERGYFHEHPRRRVIRFTLFWGLLLVVEFALGWFFFGDAYAIESDPLLLAFVLLSATFAWWKLCTAGRDWWIGLLWLIFAAIATGAGLHADWIMLVLPGAFVVIGCAFFIRRMSRRSVKGALLHAHIRHLKSALRGMRDFQLRHQLKKEPDFVSRVLPYAVALGIEKDFLRLGTQAGLAKVNYYDTTGHPYFSMDLNQVCDIGDFSPIHQGGSSGGAGGSGGGGAGGGGGGSW